MGLTILTTNDARASGLQVLATSGAAPVNATWLLPDRERALARRRTLALPASEKSPVFGVGCASLEDFVLDWWELFGEGTPFVSSSQRALLMRQALRQETECEGGTLRDTAGTVELLARVAKEQLGVASFCATLEGACDVPGLLDSEREVLRVVAGYRSLLRKERLCERASALSLLSRDASVPWPLVIVEGMSALDPSWAEFFARVSERSRVVFLVEADAGSSFEGAWTLCAQLRDAGATATCASEAHEGPCGRATELAELSARLYGLPGDEAIRPTGALRVVLPAGRYAETRALADAIAQADSDDVVVACNDPEALAASLAQLMVGYDGADGEGAFPGRFEVQASFAKPLAQTDFGRALANVSALLEGSADGFVATDLAFGALVGLDRETAWALDAKWRASRLTTCATLLQDVMERAEGRGRAFLEAASAGDLGAACAQAEAIYGASRSLSPAQRAENLTAVKQAGRFAEDAAALGLRPFDELETLLALSVGCACAWGAAESDGRGARVRVMSYGEASRLPAASVRLVIACDLNSDQQPVRTRRTPVDALVEKMGRPTRADALRESRVRFASILRAAKEGVVLERALHDAESSPANPAVLFEDVVECYRAPGAEIDKLTGLPEGLAPFSCSRGEELVGANLVGAAAGGPRRKLPVGPVDWVDAGEQGLVALRCAEDPPGQVGVVLSPSAVEDYLDCPHKWFAKRRLRITGVDVGFGPLEEGTFVHAVIRRHYERWRLQDGEPKARGGCMEAADAVLDEAFDDELSAQAQREPRDNPLVPLDEAQRHRVEDVRLLLHDFLRFDAELLPGFEPALLELTFGRDDRVEYAGLPVRGTIDRVDIDERGRAVVIDYKSSLNEGRYNLIEKGAGAFALPEKVQALMYAQIIRRLMGVQVVGALYVNTLATKTKPRLCGAYDGSVLGPQQLPGVKADRSDARQAGFGSFEELLDETERLIAERLQPLVRGEVGRCPRSEDACMYCPVLRCEGRDGR